MAVTVRSGPMRHPITIQRAVTTLDDDTGEPVDTWVSWKSWWCSKEPITASSRERMAGSGLVDEAEFIVRMRFCEGLNRKDRILLHDGTYLEILALADMQGRERMQEAMCREIVVLGVAG